MKEFKFDDVTIKANSQEEAEERAGLLIMLNEKLSVDTLNDLVYTLINNRIKTNLAIKSLDKANWKK